MAADHNSSPQGLFTAVKALCKNMYGHLEQQTNLFDYWLIVKLKLWYFRNVWN